MFAAYRGKTVAFDGYRVSVVNGELTGKSPDAERQSIREEINEARREPNRANAWIRKANGWYVDRSNCKVERRWNCEAHGRWNQRRIRQGEFASNTVLACGCRVYHKPYTGKLAVSQILKEQNATVRLAMMRCYGLERFFLDANPTVLDESSGYQLLDIVLDANGWREARVRALKMNCSTTGATYINSVPPEIETVPQGLDWMFDTTDYLGQVSQQA
jgi:hypothetical protein